MADEASMALAGVLLVEEETGAGAAADGVPEEKIFMLGVLAMMVLVRGATFSLRCNMSVEMQWSFEVARRRKAKQSAKLKETANSRTYRGGW